MAKGPPWIPDSFEYHLTAWRWMPIPQGKVLWKTLDPVCKQDIVADGPVIAGSEKISIHALREVATRRGSCPPTGPT
ncbi:MAG: hypothetical protein CMN05_15710 [Roseibacillus sp.]|nr:hypothetical protein [Roseibacillus sp.]MBP36575.1 hypothetical protein [Roseibacillus sp.]MCP4730582.1 hypothetical protein [Roseibacillus sp.]